MKKGKLKKSNVQKLTAYQKRSVKIWRLYSHDIISLKVCVCVCVCVDSIALSVENITSATNKLLFNKSSRKNKQTSKTPIYHLECVVCVCVYWCVCVCVCVDCIGQTQTDMITKVCTYACNEWVCTSMSKIKQRCRENTWWAHHTTNNCACNTL